MGFGLKGSARETARFWAVGGISSYHGSMAKALPNYLFRPYFSLALSAHQQSGNASHFSSLPLVPLSTSGERMRLDGGSPQNQRPSPLASPRQGPRVPCLCENPQETRMLDMSSWSFRIFTTSSLEPVGSELHLHTLSLERYFRVRS